MTAVGSAGIVGSNVDTLIARVMVNGSGGTITIREVGLVVSVVITVEPNVISWLLVMQKTRLLIMALLQSSVMMFAQQLELKIKIVMLKSR